MFNSETVLTQIEVRDSKFQHLLLLLLLFLTQTREMCFCTGVFVLITNPLISVCAMVPFTQSFQQGGPCCLCECCRCLIRVGGGGSTSESQSGASAALHQAPV